VPALLALLLLLGGRLVLAQGSPYLPLDHPLLPLVEHLIARGDLDDPSPMIRPFRRADLARVLQAAMPATRVAGDHPIALLDRHFRDSARESWFRVEPRAGAQAFTRARRDLLHPAGDGGVRHYVDVALEGRFGPLVFVSRPVAENRLKLDPDWSGAAINRTKNQAYRFAEAYLGAHWSRVRLFYGQMDRNWGPAGQLGLGLSNYGYPRTDLGFELRLRDVEIDIAGTQLTSMRGADGVERKRYLAAHRLNARVTRTLNLAIWETAVLAGVDQSFDPYFRNPLVLLAFPAQFGLADNRNVLLGGDLQWRPRRRVLIEAQAAIDDRWRRRPDSAGTGEGSHPGRWALTLGAAGAFGTRASWRASAAMVSSLAFRTVDSTESLLDRGVGLGPHFTDNALVRFSVSVPVRGRWLVSPDLAVLWQGEGRIDAPFPSGPALSATPELFIGQVATTYRLGATVAGGAHRLALRGTAGLHHTVNADHVRGRHRTRLEGQLLATLGFSWGGTLR
jgi:hypothetical protein